MIVFSALPSKEVSAFRAGSADAYGNPPEIAVSDGGGNPCRHCLDEIPKDRPMLILAYKPFSGCHPYAELGPIFLCGDDCTRWEDSPQPPPVVTNRQQSLIKGYNKANRIVYGTGKIIENSDVVEEAETIFRDPDVAYIHMRSSVNNCYTCRIDRG